MTTTYNIVVRVNRIRGPRENDANNKLYNRGVVFLDRL